MELADEREIEALLASHKSFSPRKRTPRRTESRDTSVYQAPFAKVRRCRCGDCATCRENARWDRIYNEKFADPDYYEQRYIRHGSSLDT